jgi:hypothetical protein
MEKRTVLFWIFIMILLVINSFIYSFIINYFIPWSNFSSILTLLLYFTVIIPLTAISSDKLTKYFLMKGLKHHNNFRTFIITLLTIVLISLCIHSISYYSEKNMEDVIRYTAIDFDFLGFTENHNQVSENEAYEWITNEGETVEELLNFLGRYDVKRVNTDEILGRDSFSFTIYHDITNPTIVRILNEKEIIIGEDFYQVVNGEIDMDWIKEFNKKFKGEL